MRSRRTLAFVTSTPQRSQTRLCSGFFYIYHSDIPSLCSARKFFRRTDRHALASVFCS
ncbi:hypothetical protein EVA_13197 [gut metagenome]|uniref:Uncharacterized protein n=1 Tax=gut metagenome TaxID=749906 RepID=J9GAB7_9ZZZZ